MPRPPAVARRAGAGRLVAAAVVLGLAPAGCSGGDHSAPTTTAAPTTTTLVPAVEVLDAGAAPRAVRRFRFTAGTTAHLEVTTDLDVDQDAGADAEAPTLDGPAVTQAISLEIGRVAADGASAELTVELGEVSIDREGTDLTDAEVVDLVAELSALRGLRATARMNDRGAVEAFAYEPPEGATARALTALDGVADQVASLTVPLPEAAIGVGARWQATTAAAIGGLRASARTTYELTAIDGDVLTYRATVVDTIAPQDLPADQLPGGTTARLTAADVEGTTTGTTDLAGLAATAEGSIAGTQELEVRGPEGTTSVTQRLQLDVRVAAAG